MTLFPDLIDDRVVVDKGVHLFVRYGGSRSKSALFLLHGYPQTLAMWHGVVAMTLLNIASTREMYASTGLDFAKHYWHWFFLIQHHPLSETLIKSEPRGYRMMKCTNQARNGNLFHPETLEEYSSTFETFALMHASCEDYRAAATIILFEFTATPESST